MRTCTLRVTALLCLIFGSLGCRRALPAETERPTLIFETRHVLAGDTVHVAMIVVESDVAGNQILKVVYAKQRLGDSEWQRSVVDSRVYGNDVRTLAAPNFAHCAIMLDDASIVVLYTLTGDAVKLKRAMPHGDDDMRWREVAAPTMPASIFDAPGDQRSAGDAHDRVIVERAHDRRVLGGDRLIVREAPAP